MIDRHFADRRFDIVVPERGWGERAAKRLAVRLDPHRSVWRAARLLGGTLAAACKKAGEGPAADGSPFESLLRCPDCGGALGRDTADTLVCGSCSYRAANEGGVYNLLPSADRAELYPGERPDVIDFSLPGHSDRLGDGWYDVEGSFGNKYRWMGGRASARLGRVRPGPQKLRVRGFAHERSFDQGRPVRIELFANQDRVAAQTLDRPGLFVIEAALPESPEYAIEIGVSPTFRLPDEDRTFGAIVSMIRLVPQD
jgi:hypothetical protein